MCHRINIWIDERGKSAAQDTSADNDTSFPLSRDPVFLACYPVNYIYPTGLANMWRSRMVA